MNLDKFGEYFEENMRAMGFTSPIRRYGTLILAIKESKHLIELVEQYGTKVTVREMIGAGKLSEQYQVVAAAGVALYAGFVIGSLLVALQRCLCKGQTLADIISAACTQQLYRPWFEEILVRYPGIYSKAQPARAAYALRTTQYA